MSKFYVGQRVRVVRPFFPVHEGITGTVVAFFPLRNDQNGNPQNCRCDWDQKELLLPGCSGGCCSTDQLEPLTDPGREVVSWEACEWKPEHLRAIPA